MRSRPVEHEAARALEELAARFERGQVDRARDVKARTLDRGDRLAAPLRAARRRHHRVQHDAAVGVEAHPVVREAGIRLRGLGRVLGDDDFDARVRKPASERVEFTDGRHGVVRRAAARWKRFESAVSGFEPNRAGRIIRTASAH